MEEVEKLKELLVAIRKNSPDIDGEECIELMMEKFAKWRPFLNYELQNWREQAKELVDNFT